MNDYHIDDLIASFYEKTPRHECDRKDCQYPSAFAMFAIVEGDEVSVTSSAHQIRPEAVVQSFINVMDQTFIDAAPDGMPASVAVASGRAMIRKAADEMKVPGDVSMEIDTIISKLGKLINDMEGSDDE